MMKTLLSVLLVIVFSLSLLLTGCGKPSQSEPVATTEPTASTQNQTAIPTVNATVETTAANTVEPTVIPTEVPTTTEAPTTYPTEKIESEPTLVTQAPTKKPTTQPTVLTTVPPSTLIIRPTAATKAPTTQPTIATTKAPTTQPTAATTKAPTTQATVVTTKAPTTQATVATTKAPTTQATVAPTVETTAPTKEPTTAPTVKPTKAPTTVTTQPTRPPVAPDAWKEDNALKILAIGNSYSVDCMEYVYEIAKAAGVENVKLGNLYIAGCALDKHLDNAKYDGIGYKFYTNSEGTWESTAPYQMSTAIESENWDFILFQQASPVSGYANTYDDLTPLIKLVEPLCTNENVQFGWHMTWAYKSGSTNGAFKNYANDQTIMYNAITSAVKLKIETNPYITKIIPNGTVIQNARTSYVGDNFTRDSSDHLTKDEGRKLAALGVVASLIGIDWDTIDLSSVITDGAFRQVAIESVRNALETPYAVTPSLITEKPA